MQQHEQVEFIKQLGAFVIEQIAQATKPLHEKIALLESRLAALPSKDEISDVIELQFAQLPKPEPIPGPPGRDGKDGSNGADGASVSVDDVLPHISAGIAEAVGQLPLPRHIVSGFIDRGGSLFHVFNDGSQLEFGKVVGADVDIEDVWARVKDELAKWPKPKDGTDGKDGKDGFGLDNFTAEFDGDRTLTLRFEDAAHSKESKAILPVPLYQGVWREGTYQRGDCVTYDGSIWIAHGETLLQPGTPDSDWQLAVKRGRDGKEGKQGKEGVTGKAGRDGKDLTQIGFDGRKW